MAPSRSVHPTLYEVMSSMRRDQNWRRTAVDNLKIEPFQHREGTYFLTPEQLLGVRVPVQRVRGDKLQGYQRILRGLKARAIAKYISLTKDYDKVMPVIEVSIDGKGNAFFTEGQHRAAGAVIARVPYKACVTKRSETQARRLFANQAKQTRLNKNVLVLDSDDSFSEYLQDAVTSDTHPWSGLVSSSQSGSSRTKMGAGTAHSLIRVYVAGTHAHAPTASSSEGMRFDAGAADELATLISCFGTRLSNPDAFTAVSLRAIAMAAYGVFRDPDRAPAPEDRDRWIRLMPRFNFNRYSYLRSSTELAERLVRHWNNHLPAARKVML